MGQQKLSIFDKFEEEFYHLLTCAFSHITLPYPVISCCFMTKTLSVLEIFFLPYRKILGGFACPILQL